MGGGTLISLVRFVNYLFPMGRVHSSAFIFSRLQLFGNIHCICLEHDHPIVHSKTVRALTSFAYRTVLLRNLHSARTGFIFTQLPYGLLNAILQRSIPDGTILLFHLQGEGVPRPLARSHALLPWSSVLACAPTVSPFPT